MAVAVNARLTLAEARAIVDRAVAKTKEFGKSAAFVVVDVGGNVITASAMEGTPGSGIVLSRAKAYLAAMDQAPTARRAERWNQRTIQYHSYASNFPYPIFTGPGGVPIEKDGQVVGAISTGPGVGGIEVDVPGIEGPVNLEDYVIACALEIPYKNQHGPMGRQGG